MDEVFGFRDSIRDCDPGFLRVSYADGSGAEIFAGDAEEIDHIGFGHFGGETFLRRSTNWPIAPNRWFIGRAKRLPWRLPTQ
jgi:hypothetical protein